MTSFKMANLLINIYNIYISVVIYIYIVRVPSPGGQALISCQNRELEKQLWMVSGEEDENQNQWDGI